MNFFPISHDLSLAELMECDPPRFHTEYSDHVFKSNAVIFPDRHMGKGHFKTACAGELVCLGSQELTNFFASCVFKRPFNRLVEATLKTPITRLIPVEELSANVVEGNSHLWATTLLNTSYAYLAKIRGDHAWPEPQPSVLFDLSFVKAGVAIHTTKSGNKKTVLKFSALVEETLDVTPEQPFIRFTGNEIANPPLGDDEVVADFIEFMLFLQHLQWKLTHGKCYISDFQGIRE